MIERIKRRIGLLNLVLAVAVILLPDISYTTDPVTIETDFDDLAVVGSEIWRVWTQLNGTNDDIMYDRVIGEIITAPAKVHVTNSLYDMDASIAPCDECINGNERIWVAWERYNPITSEENEITGFETDIIMSTRSIGTAWGTEIHPYYANNGMNEYNPDVFGDSNGFVWVAWVAEIPSGNEFTYEVQYSIYNGLDVTDDSCWWVGCRLTGGGVDLYSHPEIYESGGEIWVEWQDMTTEWHESRLIIPGSMP